MLLRRQLLGCWTSSNTQSVFHGQTCLGNITDTETETGDSIRLLTPVQLVLALSLRPLRSRDLSSRERERERERQTDRQTERERHTHTHTHAHTDKQRQTYRQRKIVHSQRDKQTDRDPCRRAPLTNSGGRLLTVGAGGVSRLGGAVVGLALLHVLRHNGVYQRQGLQAPLCAVLTNTHIIHCC